MTRFAGPLLALSVLTAAAAGCGSSSSSGPSSHAPTPAPSPVTVLTGGNEQSVIVHHGDRIRLLLPPGGQISENGLSRMADEGNGVFRAVGVGTASLEVVQEPSCKAGQQCSNLIRLLSVVEVTVKK